MSSRLADRQQLRCSDFLQVKLKTIKNKSFLHRHTQKKNCCCCLPETRKVWVGFLLVREAAVHTRIVVFGNDSFSAWLTAVVAIAKLWAKGTEGHR